jgi:hypothetical protein
MFSAGTKSVQANGEYYLRLLNAHLRSIYLKRIKHKIWYVPIIFLLPMIDLLSSTLSIGSMEPPGAEPGGSC